MMAWLSGWSDRAMLTIEGGGGITSDVTDFPLTIKLTESSGKTNVDMSRLFEKLAYSNELLNDDFTGTDYSKPNSYNWYYHETTHGSVNILNNKLNLTASSSASEEYNNVSSKYNLSGDFDVQVSFDNLAVNSVNGCGFEVKLTEVDGNQSDNRILVKAAYQSGNVFTGGITIAGNYISTDISRTNNYGQLRASRIGDTATVYCKDGDAATWTQIYTRSGYQSADCKLFLGNWSPTPGGAVSGNFDSLIIDSENITWLPGMFPNRKKIAITESDGTSMLYTEVQHWDPVNKVIVLWTKVPLIEAGVDTVLYLYYDGTQLDNVNFIGNVGELAAQNVWSGDSGKYKAVYHMSEYPFNSSIKDSTSNAYDLSTNGSMTIDDLVDSEMLGYALDFDGSNDYLALAASKANVLMGNVDSANALSISCWVKQANTSTHYLFMYGVGGDPENNMEFRIGSTIYLFYEYGSGSNYGGISSPSITNPTDLHHVYLTIDGSLTKMYLDGYLVLSQPAASSFWSKNSTRNLIIGAYDSIPSANYMNGKLFEYHVSNKMHTADQVRLTYLAESDNLITYTQYIGYISGYVYIEDTVVGGVDVYLYSRENGNYMGQTTSSGNGYFIIPTTYSGSHFVVALDKDDPPTYNDIIKGRIPPHLLS